MEWGDAGLEQYMRRHTDITEGDNMLSDVWPMTYITSQNGGIVDVTALRELNNLTEL